MDREALLGLAEAFRQISRGAIRGFVQPYLMRAVYVELRQCVTIPLADVIDAIEGALAAREGGG